MKRLFPTTIFFKLLLAALLPIALLATVLSVYAANARLDDLDNALRERGEAHAQQMASSALLGLFTGDESLLQSAAERHLLRDAQLLEVMVYDRDDNKVATAVRELEGMAGEASSSYSAYVEQPSLEYEFDSPVLAAQSIGRVVVTFSDIAADEAAADIVRNTLLISLLAVMLSGLFAVVIGRQIVRPIVVLRQAVRRLREGDMDARVEESSTGEIGELEIGFNAMADSVSASADELLYEVAQATSDLQQTMDALEIRNIQLDIARKQALEANAAKSVFLANMSHEIRTPMNGVLGFAKLLRKSPLDDNQSVYVQTIIDSAGHLMGSINDILDFSKMEAGKLTLESHVFSLTEAIEESVQLMSAQASNKGLDLSLQLGEDLPDAVRGDGLRLKQILNNLLGNAIKFTEQGQVEVRVAKQVRSDDRVWIAMVVRDTGIGIPAEVMQQLFQPFSQAAPSTTRLYGGSGLGLSICRRLAETMGGAIDAKSTEGLGSEFTVTLPLDSVQETPSSGKISAKPRPGSDWLEGRVCLVADDNAINLQLIELLLANLGAEVLTAVDGEDAVAVTLSHNVDVALLDIHMPRLDGLGAAERIIAKDPQLPIIALTADMTIVQRLDDQATLFSACLGKPLDETQLIEALAQTLQLPLSRESFVSAEEDSELNSSLVRDCERATAQAAGSEAIADALFSDFMDALPDALQDIRDAHGTGDAEQLWQSAHRLQGAAATCSLPALHDALAGLARAVKADSAEDITDKMADLDREVGRLIELAGR